MSKKGGGFRSASTGRYVSASHGRSHPGTTVNEAPGRSGSSGPHYRSASTGRYVSDHYGKTHPGTTVREK
ncbi:hypothetical protein [Sphingobium tyrosinilyticum]|uniref:ABC transporter ATP-binding protein n=1 Tax=Sphingobium tyrosinilyticum TaxID=2715436 RepID=A0ABV9F143_9SPHN